MSEHPIEGLMLSAMSSIKDMVDVNTIIGDPITSSDGMIIIPVSKVSFGFAAGGSEFSAETVAEYVKTDKERESIKYKLPFGGGSGAGVSINPVAFIVVKGESAKLLPINYSSCTEKLLDYIPNLLEKIGKKIPKKDIADILKDDKKQNVEEVKIDFEEDSEDDEEE